ncbi:class I SAM-dependent methyltransferase [Roseimaritima sediminicola]|uniref:class I SAM-dependent methyltransferase n=1 Tax=Roseimaritima sediminicola TaxID=2662066 RepID=UPI00129839CE|nr:methyltransferase domain-containing protein [Roseimaritima sediminicola]
MNATLEDPAPTAPPERPSRKRKRSKQANPERSRLYSKFIPAYEAVWPLLVQRRVRRSIERLNIQPGNKVLEVGIGTGMSMPAYPRHAQVTGIDLSEEMLAEAERKIAREGWDHISVRPMNAQQLDFPDQSFDFVTTFHVVSVVADPQQMMSEIARVVKPGGSVLIINHFRSENPWIAKVIDRADTFTRHLGWRTNVSSQDVVGRLPLDVRTQTKSSPFSLFTVLHATRTDE